MQFAKQQNNVQAYVILTECLNQDLWSVAKPGWGGRVHGPSRNKLPKNFTGALYKLSTVRK